MPKYQVTQKIPCVATFRHYCHADSEAEALQNVRAGRIDETAPLREQDVTRRAFVRPQPEVQLVEMFPSEQPEALSAADVARKLEAYDALVAACQAYAQAARDYRVERNVTFAEWCQHHQVSLKVEEAMAKTQAPIPDRVTLPEPRPVFDPRTDSQIDLKQLVDQYYSEPTDKPITAFTATQEAAAAVLLLRDSVDQLVYQASLLNETIRDK